MIHWFRSHHGAPFDSKLAVVAKRASVTRGHAASLWWAVIDFASQNEDRGSTAGIDVETLATAFDYSEIDVQKVLDAMRHKSLLIGPDERLINWDKRQVSREDDTAAERKRRQREREKQRDSHVASRNVTIDYTRLEEIKEEGGGVSAREEISPPPKPLIGDTEFHRVGSLVLEAMGVAANPRWLGNYASVASWLGAKYDPDLDILPTIRRLMAVKIEKGEPAPKSLNYFTEAIGRANLDRLQDIPAFLDRRPTNGKRPNGPIGSIARTQAFLDKMAEEGAI